MIQFRLFIICILASLIFTINTTLAQTGPGGVGTDNSITIWLDASDIGLTNGARVTKWKDKSTNGYDFGEVLSTDYTYFNVTSNTYTSLNYPNLRISNGVKSVLFNDANYEALQSNGRITSTGTASGIKNIGTDQFSIVAVFKTNDKDYGLINYQRSRFDLKTLFYGTAYNDNGRQQLVLNTSENSTPWDAVVDDKVNIQMVTWDKTGGNYAAYSNGAVDVLGGSGTSLAANQSIDHSGKMYLGLAPTNSGTINNAMELYDGDIYEMLLFSQPINYAQRIILNNYFKTKYPELGIRIAENLFSTNSEYKHDFIGVGRGFSNQDHLQSEAGGLTISFNAPLSTTGTKAPTIDSYEWIMGAHNNNKEKKLRYRKEATEALGRQWNLTIRKRKNKDPTFIEPGVTATLEFNLKDITGSDVTLGNANDYVLLAYTSSGDIYKDVARAISVESGSTVRFDLDFDIVNRDKLQGVNVDGNGNSIITINRRFAIGTKDPVNSPLYAEKTWYSYSDGDWDDPNTWTLDASGQNFQNPLLETPQKGDSVVITQKVFIPTGTNNISIKGLNLLGSLDIGETTGHNFKSISGDGNLTVQGSSGIDNFPVADYTKFIDQNTGGTVYIKGSGFTTKSAKTFRNLIIDLDSNTNEFVLLHDLNLNGSLQIIKGKLKINDDADTNPLNVEVIKDLTVGTDGGLTVGRGNIYKSAVQSTIGNWHKAHHMLVLNGDFINDGVVKLTNQDKPVYLSESTTGAVTLVMQGASDNVLTANNTTDLYKFVINKGTDKTHKLTVSASDAKNFVLYGPNNLDYRVNGTTGEFFKNPENRKALWIKRGSLVLEDKVYIPSLTEAGSDFVIGEDAALILNGADVKVFSTNYDDGDNTVIAENEADYSIIEIALDIKSDGANAGISVLGLLQIDDGEYNSGNSSGINFLVNAPGTVVLNSGTLNLTQISDHSAIGSLIINGGQLRLRDKGEDDETVGILSFSNPNSQFTFTAGEIVIASVSNITDIPDVDIQSSSGNFQVTDGKLVIEIDNYDDSSQALGQVPVHLNITPNLFDLEVRKGRAILLNDLQVNNDVVIAGDSTDPPSLDLGTSNNTVDIKGNLYVAVENGGQSNGHLYSREGIVKMSGNADQTLSYFSGATMAFSLLPTATTTTATTKDGEIYHLIIDNAAGNVNIVPSGGSGKTLIIRNHLEILEGRLNANISAEVYIYGDVTSNGIFNGELYVNNDIQHSFTLGQDAGFEGSFTTNLTGTILVDGTLVVDDLTMNGGVIDMSDDLMTVNTFTLGTIPNDGSNMIAFSGKVSAKGLRMNNTTGARDLTFPIGVNDGSNSRYTGAKTKFTNSYRGSVTVTPIASALSTLNPSGTGNKLDFYWKVKYESVVSNTVDFEATYSNVDFNNKVIATVDDMVTGQVINKGARIGEREVLNTTAVDSNPVLFGEASQVDASYTIADDSYFVDKALSFYSRANHVSDKRTINWSDPTSWSNNTINGGAASRVPKAGDLVFIGSNHIVQVNSASNEASKITFLSRTYPSRLDYPRIEVLDVGVQTTLKFDEIEGNGFISLDVSSYSTSPVIDADLSSFLADPDNFFQYNIIDNGVGPPAMGKKYSTYPTLILNQTGNTQDNYFNLDNSFTVLKDMEIVGDLNVRLLDAAQANTIEVENDLLIGQGAKGGQLLFTSDGTNKFDFIVKGDVDLTRGTSGTEMIGLDGTNAGLVVHEFHAYQDVKLGDGSLDFYEPNSNKIAFHARGDGNHGLSMSNPPAYNSEEFDFYTINIEKGTSATNSFSIDARFTLNGPTDGLSTQKALQLTTGILTVNAPGSTIPLSTGGSDFKIGNNTGLILKAGTYTVSGADNGIYLDGLLQIEGEFARLNLAITPDQNNYIEYSSSGDAELNIKEGKLWVNTQIRRSLTNGGGILKYDQEGGEVILGRSTASHNSRGMLEILNPGSSFRHDAGTITIVNGNGSTATPPLVPALILTPDTFVDPITNTGVINLGQNLGSAPSLLKFNTQSTANRLDYNIAVPIAGIRFGGLGAVSNQLVNDLEVTKSGIYIEGSGDTDSEIHRVIAANNNIRFTGDLIMRGGLDISSKPTLRLESVVPSGGNFVVTLNRDRSKYSISNFVKKGSGTLAISDNYGSGESGFFINNDLEILEGVLEDNGYTITVGGNIINDGIHKSNRDLNRDRGIVMRPSEAGTQYITRSQNGTAEFGRLIIDNPAGVSIPTDKDIEVKVNKGVELISGVFDIGTSLLTLGKDAVIEDKNGGGFSKDLMIRVSSASNASGVKKSFNGGNEFLWPIGIEEYTPAMVEFTSVGSTDFSITMRPVNELHPYIQQDEENPDPELDDSKNVLQYYWKTKSEGISNFNLKYIFSFNPNDALVESYSYTLADYRGTRLTYSDLLFSQALTDNFDETNNKITFNIAGADDADFESDYTAGVDPLNKHAAIPPGGVVDYVSIASGDYDNPTIWKPNSPNGGPKNAKVTIASNTTVTMRNVTDPNLKLMTIEDKAVLDIGPNISMNFGHITGTGTMKSKNGYVPAQGGNLEAGLVDFYSCDGGSIEFYSNLNYAIDSELTEISALTLSGLGLKRLSNVDLKVCNDLHLKEGTLLNPSGSNLSIGGDLIVKPNANLKMALSTAGSQPGSQLIFDGDSPQTFSGEVDKGSTRFVYDLVLNNPMGLTKTNGIVSISKSLRLVNGVLNTYKNPFNSNYDGIRLGENAKVYGSFGGNLPFEGATDRYINGPLTKKLDANNDFVFPIGDNGDLGQVKITRGTGTGSAEFMVIYFSESPATEINRNLHENSSLVRVSDVEFWKIIGKDKATVSLFYDSNSDVTDPATLRVVEWDQDPGNKFKWRESYSGNSSGAKIDDPYNLNTYLGVVSRDAGNGEFIDFSIDKWLTIGTVDDINKLPIKLVSFTGKLNKQGVQLEWATSSEVNNDYFVIERTIDGETFETLDTVDSKGNGNILKSYEFIDELPNIGDNYYRLKQVDFDGTSTYSGLVLVAYKPVFKPLEVSIYPNPINNKRFELLARNGNYQQDISLQLMDIYGNIVFDMSYEASITNVTQEVKLHKDIKSGVYIANILQGDRLIQKRVIIK